MMSFGGCGDVAEQQFITITSASSDVARRYLRLADGNVERAIILFIDSPDLVDFESDNHTSPPHRQTSGNVTDDNDNNGTVNYVAHTHTRNHSHSGNGYHEDSNGVIHIDSDKDEQPTHHNIIDYHDHLSGSLVVDVTGDNDDLDELYQVEREDDMDDIDDYEDYENYDEMEQDDDDDDDDDIDEESIDNVEKDYDDASDGDADTNENGEHTTDLVEISPDDESEETTDIDSASPSGRAQCDSQTITSYSPATGASSTSALPPDTSDGVRAPIPSTMERLLGPTYSDWHGSFGLENTSPLISEHFQMMENRRRASRMSIFHQRDIQSSIWDFPTPTPVENDGDDETSHHDQSTVPIASTVLNHTTVTAQPSAPSKTSILADMFRPPFDLITRLTWEQARREGTSVERWILVNIQDASIFDCQVLNRDLWKHEGVRETVQKNFIFFQYTVDDIRAENYIRFYMAGGYLEATDEQARSTLYPHIAIIDPRTGEQVKVWSGPPVPKATEFIMELLDFLDRFSLKANARNPLPARPPPRPITVKAISQMSEAEMLELALKNSLADMEPAITTAESSSSASSRDTNDENATRETELAAAEDAEFVQTLRTFNAISSHHAHVEPPSSSGSSESGSSEVTRIQIRYARGRIIRRFNVTDKVRRIFEWIKAEVAESINGDTHSTVETSSRYNGSALQDLVSDLRIADGIELSDDLDGRIRPFQLVCLGRNLLAALEESLLQAGLSNATIMLEVID